MDPAENNTEIMTVTADSTSIAPADLEHSLNETKGVLQAVNRITKEVLKDNVDYMQIPGTPKPTLLQNGAHQLCKLFGFQPEFIVESKTEDRNESPAFFEYIVRCKLFYTRTGAVIAEGIGSCNTWESKYKYRWMKAPNELQNKWSEYRGNPDYRSRKINNGYVLQMRAPNPDIFDLLNTVLKMAKKRAYVDAVLTATGAGRIFTQDLEDIKHALDLEDEQSARQHGQSQGKAQTASQPVSKNQLKYIKNLMGQANVDSAFVRKLVSDDYGKHSSKDLTAAEASKLIEDLKAMISNNKGGGRRA